MNATASRAALCDRLERDAREAVKQMLMRHPASPLRGKPAEAGELARAVVSAAMRSANL